MWTSIARVATPAAMGVAMDVPDITVMSVSDSDIAARMPVPGAQRLTHAPQFEKRAFESSTFEAPMVIW